MASLDGITASAATRLRSLSTSVSASPPWVLGATGVPFVLIAGTYAFQELGLDSMGGGVANTMFNGAAGVGGFLTLLIAGRKIDSLGRDVHIAELLPSIIAVGGSGIVAALLLTPPSDNIVMNAWGNALSAAGVTSGGAA